jgi:hypothetical protein
VALIFKTGPQFLLQMSKPPAACQGQLQMGSGIFGLQKNGAAAGARTPAGRNALFQQNNADLAPGKMVSDGGPDYSAPDDDNIGANRQQYKLL